MIYLRTLVNVSKNNERPVSAYDQVAFPKVRVNEEVQVAGKNASLERQIIIT